ncbi:MAG: hypothetical protein H7318_17060 [Oligoflexus sp.]|nr:hypothetical protein [Oligoflexus sp.]
MRSYLLIFMTLIVCCPLYGAEVVASDACSSKNPSLTWSSMQATIVGSSRKLPKNANPDEANLIVRFDQLGQVEKTGKTGLLTLAQDMQNAILTSRKPSHNLKQHWIATLLATEQSDIAYKILAKSLNRDQLDQFLFAESLFMQKRYRDSEIEFKKVSASQPGVKLFLQWRLAELSLHFGNITESWRHLSAVMKRLPLDRLSKDLQIALELDLIQYGQSRLESNEFWSKVPAAVDHERVAICVLRSPATSNTAKQNAFQQLNLLSATTDASVDYFRRSLAQLDNVHAARKSYVSMIQSGLQSALKHEVPKSPARQSLLVDLQKTAQNLLVGSGHPDQAPTNRQLVQALDAFTSIGSPSETLLFRQAKANLLETLGHWYEAAREYEALITLSPDHSERGKLAWSMLKAYRKATPPINEGDSRLPKEDLYVANGLMQACATFNTYWPHAEDERRECEGFSIKLAMNQGNEQLAKQKLWLFIAQYPEHSTEAIYSLLQLFKDDNATLIVGCEKLLRIPALQNGQIGGYLRDNLRASRYEEIAKIKSPNDRAAAYASFAERERPHDLALAAISKAIDIKTAWQTKANYLKIYIDKFPSGSDRMENYLKLAELYEENFALRDAYVLLQSARQLAWSPDLMERRSSIECRINRVEHPLEAISSCLAVATANKRAPIELAKRLLWAHEAEALHKFVSADNMARMNFNLNEQIEILGIAFEGTESIPSMNNEIKTALYDLYAEDPDHFTADSRRILASIAYNIAQKALPLFLNMPIYAGRSDELASAIQAKHAAFADLEGLYSKVLGTKDPYWGSSALADLATASFHLSQSLKTIGPVEGIDIKALENQLNGPVGQWSARSKSYANASEKTLERFSILHRDARRMKLDMENLRGDPVLFTDALPEWELPFVF